MAKIKEERHELCRTKPQSSFSPRNLSAWGVGLAALVMLAACATPPPLAKSDRAPVVQAIGAANETKGDEANDVALAPLVTIHADWSEDLGDQSVLSGFSQAVVSGDVVGEGESFVDSNGTIVTRYTVRVGEVFKGDGIGDTVSVVLPGGTVSLGEYIKALDELGYYDMKLGRKSDEIMRAAGEDPEKWQDPRLADPSLPVTENFGLNPTSPSTVEALQPDAWIFYLNAQDEEGYYGAGFDYALAYVEGDAVFTLHPEAQDKTFPLDDLRKI